MKHNFYIIISITLITTYFISCKNSDADNKSTEVKKEITTSSKHNYEVNISDTIASIQSTMYGIFFEDINFGADGGIYAELVKNRSFEFIEPMMGWDQPESDRFSLNDKSGFAVPINHDDNTANGKFLRVKVFNDKGYRLVNEGFRGMGFKKDMKYNLSLNAKQMEGNTSLIVELIDTSKNVLATSTIKFDGKGWKEYTATLTSNKSEMKGKLNIRFEGKGIVDIDMVSMFPSDTWMNRPKGLRNDLIQLLADLKPGFLRFPGGCIVEGMTLARRYQWKTTIGDIKDRKTIINRWNSEFKHKLAPDYFQSFGVGFYEYFLLSEDIGATPLPILNCGMACQFNTAELVPLDELQPYIDDALDLIEFANGPVASKWGKLRSDMGHPAPFNMKYLGIGNEQWGPAYFERYRVFEKAIKEKHPEILIVSSAGPFPDGEMFDYGWKELKNSKVDIVDEHYYRPPQWFLDNATRYDGYDRKGPKVFAGEYAAQSVAIASPDNKNNWDCALSEAAYMTGLERNADVVTMTSYAPLFAHAEGWQWTPDLIWFNNLEAYGTPNYYVQKLYSNNAGTNLLKITEDNNPVIGGKGVYTSAVVDKKSNELIIKVVNVTTAKQDIIVNAKGLSTATTGKLISLKNNDKNAENTFASPKNIFPVESNLKFTNNQIAFSVESKSMNVIRIPIK